MTNYYQKHLFICLNQREDGRACCQNHNASEIRSYAKQRLKELGLWGKDKIRLSASGCLGRCLQGPSLVVYPDNVWYSYQTSEDIDEIINEHLIKGKIVERLLMPHQD